jgi:hypothetical protein
VQLAPDAPDWWPLMEWAVPDFIVDYSLPCLPARPRDPAHPDVVVTDTSDGKTTWMPTCAENQGQPSCWEIVDDLRCPGIQQRINVRRPPTGVTSYTVTEMAYDCAP